MIPSRMRLFLSKRNPFWHSNTLALICLTLGILLVGLVRIPLIPYSAANGAPLDETFHFGRVLDTLALLNQWGLGAGGARLQAEYQQAEAAYLPQNPLSYTTFNDYWQSIGFYAVQALVQLAVPGLSLIGRLYLARFVNVFFQVLLAIVVYGVSVRVFRRPAIALALAGILSFIPTLATSAATVTTEMLGFVGCLVMFAALVYFYRNGWSIKTCLWFLLGVLSCLLTKNTSWPLIVIVIYMVLRRVGVPWLAFAAVALLAMVGAATQFYPQGAAHWYRDLLPWDAWAGSDSTLGYVDNRISQFGPNSLMVASINADHPLIQYLPEAALTEVRGQMVTIGSWVRAPTGKPIVLPVIQQAQKGTAFTSIPQAEHIIKASGDWEFAQYQVMIPTQVDYVRVALWQLPNSDVPAWYDGLVMVAANIPEGGQPHFTDESVSQGTWSGQAFVNLIQNGSFENQWWGVDSARWEVEYPVNQRFYAWQDVSRTGGAYLTAGRAIYATVLGSFQNDFPGLTPWQLIGVGLILATGLVSCLLYWLRLSRISPERQIPAWVIEGWFIWLVLYLAIDLLRADVSGSWANPFFYATGRFIVPVLFPLWGLTLIGLSGWLPRRLQSWMLTSLVVAMFLLNIWVFLKVESPYYHCPTSPRWSCIASLY